ncbi:MAG: DUF1273 domain-containing protein [Ruminococcaceae bacterium]|nr:DUF1273 domain-containing protein [Oscillospiraceae bacterium]
MSEFKNKTCCFTGHRNIPQDQRDALMERLKKEIVLLAGNGYCRFIAGGALGFDTMAAEAVLALKSQYPTLQLALALPHTEQAKSWSEQDRAVYNDILQRADSVTYTSAGRGRGCMQIRNRYMVDHSSFCICYLAKDNGGTAYTVKYAGKRGVAVVNIAI